MEGIVVTSSALTISSMTVEFFGVYTLVVTNNFGTSTISIIISLNGDDNGGHYFRTTTQSTYYTTDYLTSDSTAVWSTATTTRYVTITDYYRISAVWPITTSKYYTTSSAWTMTSDWSTTTTGYVFTTDYITTTAYIKDYSTTIGFIFTTDFNTTTGYITDYTNTDNYRLFYGLFYCSLVFYDGTVPLMQLNQLFYIKKFFYKHDTHQTSYLHLLKVHL
ncbi:hypothetical protein SNEBB_008944 [Seison nebaliae]|nr:hypothetical protein SNEBB_008944 [Seison nebaliae]